MLKLARKLWEELSDVDLADQGRTAWSADLPESVDWGHVWSGRVWFGRASTGGQEVAVAAPFGQPPVFYRAGSGFTELFTTLKAI